MGFIGETKELVFGKLEMVGDAVSDKVDFQAVKIQITDSYAKAVSKAEEVPAYVSY